MVLSLVIVNTVHVHKKERAGKTCGWPASGHDHGHSGSHPLKFAMKRCLSRHRFSCCYRCSLYTTVHTVCITYNALHCAHGAANSWQTQAELTRVLGLRKWAQTESSHLRRCHLRSGNALDGKGHIVSGAIIVQTQDSQRRGFMYVMGTARMSNTYSN